MATPQPDYLAFDDVTIDFAGHRLLRGGVEHPLEPKAFAVLALLAGTPGKVFARDDILDAVWRHRHVTPGVLNRIMTLLRHALGEDAHAPRYLHTLHGVGYRFDLPLHDAGLTPDSTGGVAVAPAQVVPGDLEDPGEAQAAGFQRRAGDRLPPPTLRSVARLLPLLLLMVLLIVLAMALLAVTLPWPRPQPSSPAPAAMPTALVVTALVVHRAAVLPFADASSEAGHRYPSRRIAESLVHALH